MNPIRDDDRPKRSGCFSPWVLGCIAGPILLVVGCFALAGGSFLWIKSSLPEKPALERARANREVIGALGAPLEKKGSNQVMTYNANSSSGSKSTQAAFRFTVGGPKGQGSILVEGEKRKGAWHYRRMELTVAKTGAVIDLRTPGEKTAAGPEEVVKGEGDATPP